MKSIMTKIVNRVFCSNETYTTKELMIAITIILIVGIGGFLFWGFFLTTLTHDMLSALSAIQ